jgi:DNA-binding FrmR family transcriptional regulator
MAHEHEHEHEPAHEQEQEHAHGHEEAHTHPHSYAHFHSPEEKKRQLNRLSRVIGHLQHVKKMIEADEDCADVLNQLSATRSAITGLGKEIMNEHVRHCISHAIKDGDMEAVEEFQKAIEKFF